MCLYHKINGFPWAPRLPENTSWLLSSQRQRRMYGPIYSPLMQLWNAHPLHFICMGWDWTLHGARQLGGKVTPKNNTMFSLPTFQSLQRLGVLQSPLPSGCSLGALMPRGSLQKGKAHMKIRSREVMTCLWLISAPKTGISTVSPPWLTFCLCTVNPHSKCRVQLCVYHSKPSTAKIWIKTAPFH